MSLLLASAPFVPRITASPVRIARRSHATNSGAISSTAWTVNKPANAQIGDFVLVALALNDTTLPAAVSGFTQLAQVSSTADGGSFTVWGRVLDGTEAAVLTGTLTSTGFNNWAVEALCYSNVDAITPTDGVSTLASSASSASPITMTLPSVTTTVANDMLVAFYSLDVTTANAGNPSHGTPTGMTAIESIISPRQVADVSAFDVLQPTFGASGTKVSTATFPATAAGQLGALIALQPVGVHPMTLVGTLTGTGNTSTAYSSTLTLGGVFTAPVTMSTASGSLPAGITASVSGNTVTYSGTPTTAGSYTFVPRATSTDGQVADGPSQTIAVSAGFVGVVQTSLNQKSTGVAGASSVTYTPATPFTAGNKVIVCINKDTSPIVSGVTINGVAATKMISIANGVCAADIWVGTAGSGSAGWTITFASSATLYVTSSAVERDDLAASPLDKTVTATGSSVSPSATTAATTQAKETIIAVMCGQNNTNSAISYPSGYTGLHTEPNGNAQAPGAAAYKDVAATGTQTATFTYAASHTWGCAIATLKLL